MRRDSAGRAARRSVGQLTVIVAPLVNAVALEFVRLRRRARNLYLPVPLFGVNVVDVPVALLITPTHEVVPGYSTWMSSP